MARLNDGRQCYGSPGKKNLLYTKETGPEELKLHPLTKLKLVAGWYWVFLLIVCPRLVLRSYLIS